GIYVELLENKCEGMVRIASMKDDYYVFEEERFLIRGNNTGKTYQLGGSVTIRVVEANLASRTIDFEFVDEDEEVTVEGESAA
ncbi:MAG: ribonuclease R, partial [Bacteroidota bacterium]|nr:ribonuclease R [Bacteroidota bacterium]